MTAASFGERAKRDSGSFSDMSISLGKFFTKGVISINEYKADSHCCAFLGLFCSSVEKPIVKVATVSEVKASRVR